MEGNVCDVTRSPTKIGTESNPCFQDRLETLVLQLLTIVYLLMPYFGLHAQGHPGVIFLRGLASGTAFGGVSIVGLKKESGSKSFANYKIPTWNGCFLIARSSVHIPMQLAKKGAKNGISWPFAWWIWHQNPRCSRWIGQPGRASIEWWGSSGYYSCGTVN